MKKELKKEITEVITDFVEEAVNSKIQEQQNLRIEKPDFEFLRREEVANLLKVTKQTIINYTQKGLLISYKVGKRVLYRKDEVLNAINKSHIYIFKRAN